MVMNSFYGGVSRAAIWKLYGLHRLGMEGDRQLDFSIAQWYI